MKGVIMWLIGVLFGVVGMLAFDIGNRVSDRVVQFLVQGVGAAVTGLVFGAVFSVILINASKARAEADMRRVTAFDPGAPYDNYAYGYGRQSPPPQVVVVPQQPPPQPQQAPVSIYERTLAPSAIRQYKKTDSGDSDPWSKI